MRIKNVLILNWKAHGKEWWGEIASWPEEPLIEVKMTMTLSHKEYNELLDRSEATESEFVVPRLSTR